MRPLGTPYHLHDSPFASASGPVATCCCIRVSRRAVGASRSFRATNAGSATGSVGGWTPAVSRVAWCGSCGWDAETRHAHDWRVTLRDLEARGPECPACGALDWRTAKGARAVPPNGGAPPYQPDPWRLAAYQTPPDAPYEPDVPYRMPPAISAAERRAERAWRVREADRVRLLARGLIALGVGES